MAKFTRSTNISGKYKDICVTENGNFIDSETGEIIDISSQLYQIYGDSPFELSTSLKINDNLE